MELIWRNIRGEKEKLISKFCCYGRPTLQITPASEYAPADALGHHRPTEIECETHTCFSIFLVDTLKGKNVKKKVTLIWKFCWTQYMQNTVLSICNQYKQFNTMFYIPLFTFSLRNPVWSLSLWRICFWTGHISRMQEPHVGSGCHCGQAAGEQVSKRGTLTRVIWKTRCKCSSWVPYSTWCHLVFSHALCAVIPKTLGASGYLFSD